MTAWQAASAIRETTPNRDNPWKDPDLPQKVGRFRLSGIIEERYGLNFLHLLQSSCIIRWTERQWHRDETVYVVLNPSFTTVPEGNLIPWYNVVIEDDGDGVIGFGFEPIEDPNYEEPRA